MSTGLFRMHWLLLLYYNINIAFANNKVYFFTKLKKPVSSRYLYRRSYSPLLVTITYIGMIIIFYFILKLWRGLHFEYYVLILNLGIIVFINKKFLIIKKKKFLIIIDRFLGLPEFRSIRFSYIIQVVKYLTS